MSMLPQPGRPEEEGESRPYYPDSSQGYYPDLRRPQRKFSTKIKILGFAVMAGTLLAILFSFVNTVFLMMSDQGTNFFGDRFGGSRLFFPVFVGLFSSYAPLFIVAAAIAAAAEHMIRRASQSSSQQNRALVDALRELSGRNPPSRRTDGPESTDPLLKNLNLEIDPRERP
ncbi:MAG TPA: hypothetical protein VKE98_22470 [Gemmataceae bacterium]|nr:hypothetical protein [Gemmataceae bacterium]